MMSKSYFITGTDTGIGKTVISIALLESIKHAGKLVCGMKPVASGCYDLADEMVSEDALLIKKHASIDLPYNLVNPLPLKNPCAPNIAAELELQGLEIAPVLKAFNWVSGQCEVLIIEGIGGWRCPVFSDLGMADMVKAMNIPVILVVGIKIGCLNHAVLSVESILRDNVTLAGWIANIVDPDFQYPQQTINHLMDQIKAPHMGTVPYQDQLDYQGLYQYISLPGL